MPTTVPQIGKDVIESLTLGMYEDSRFVYREYIQNAADAVDKARDCGLLAEDEDAIHVVIDKARRLIEVIDNATGVPQADIASVLLNIAHSTKKRGEDKGFRGIGRLGGLGYCKRLRFETSAPGEDVCTVMTWDAELLKNIINDRESHEEAVEVLARVTSTATQAEAADKHYFRVVMEGVTNDTLLNRECVTDYLAMVAPVDISSSFLFRSKINDFRREHGIDVDTYNIYVNSDQIYKPYTNVIYDDNNGGKKKIDDITDVGFLLNTDANGDIVYWGWYTISSLKGQMKSSKNIARGIRLRKENIQIGDEARCQRFFTNTSDGRFTFYYFGEIHALGKGLIPNSRRDYFGENGECAAFETLLKRDFQKLRDLCYDMSKIRSNKSTIDKFNELRAKIGEKDKTGYTSTEERETLQKSYVEIRKKADIAQRKLDKTVKEMEENGSPLQAVVKNVKATKTTLPQPKEKPATEPKVTYRTDQPRYSTFGKKEKRLIGRIYTVIAKALPDERMSEALISKIEEEITK